MATSYDGLSLLVVVGQATKVPLTPASGTLGAPGRKTLKLALSAAVQKRLARLLAQDKHARATATVRAADRAGPPSCPPCSLPSAWALSDLVDPVADPPEAPRSA